MQPVWHLRICQTFILLLFNQLTTVNASECAVLIHGVFHLSDETNHAANTKTQWFLKCCT